MLPPTPGARGSLGTPLPLGEPVNAGPSARPPPHAPAHIPETPRGPGILRPDSDPPVAYDLEVGSYRRTFSSRERVNPMLKRRIQGHITCDEGEPYRWNAYWLIGGGVVVTPPRPPRKPGK